MTLKLIKYVKDGILDPLNIRYDEKKWKFILIYTVALWFRKPLYTALAAILN